MRRYRSALILLLILALMAGGYWFYTYMWPQLKPGGDEAEEEAAPSTYESLVEGGTSDILELKIDYLAQEYVAVKEIVMEKTEGSDKEREVTHWRLSNRSDFPVDSSKLASAASNFCSITSSKVVEEYAADLAQFGFGGPSSATVSGTFKDGVVVTLEIGDKNPTNDGYYVRKDGGKTVYLGSTYSTEKLLLKPSDIADLSLFALADADISRVEMTRGGAPLFAAWRKGEYNWELEYPVIAPFNTTAQGMIFDSVSDVSASAYEEMNAPDLAKYGLDKPRYALTLERSDGGEHIGLLFGSEKEVRSTIYAMLEGTRDVFTLSLDKFGYLDKPIKEFVDVFAYIVNINTVNHIQADFDGRSVSIDIETDKDDTDNDRFTIDGTDVSGLKNDKDRSLFRQFYQALIGVTIYDIETDAGPADAGAEIAFLYELKEEPYTMLVEFVPKDERLYYVFRNHAYAGITCEKRLFNKADEGLRDTWAAMKAAMDAARPA